MSGGGTVNDPLKAISAIEGPAWLVGGALRDRLLGRPTTDYDVTVEGDPGALARQLAKLIPGHPFELSEGFGVWRVISRDRRWTVDLLPLAGDSIESDLSRRDLTVNAIAQRLPEQELIDPYGGLRDLRERRLRMVSAEAFAEDPLRSLRLVRLACELGFSAEPDTAAAAARSAPELARVAPERSFAELKRIIGSERAVSGVKLIDELGITPVLLPELAALHGVEQSPYHHLDVYEHTLAVLAETIELESDPAAVLGANAQEVDEFLSRRLANELTRWQALRFGALLHDIAKPQTREVSTQGRITFLGHDAAGSHTAAEVLTRLRASERLATHVAGLARHHLRLGFMVHEVTLPRRGIYRYLRECDPVQVDVTVLSVADRLATRGAGSAEAIAKHVALAQQLLGEALAWAANPPRPPMRGDRLARALGIEPGPELGRILAELEEASFAEEIESEEDALARARELLHERSIRSSPMNDEECIFCKIIAGEIPAQIIDQDELTVAFMDINPATRGHALVVPRRHVRDLLEIDPSELVATIMAAQRLAAKMPDRLGAAGVNLLNSCGRAAWQTVFHFHLHVIPRYQDDPLRLPWTPAEGDPDEIAQAAQALR